MSGLANRTINQALADSRAIHFLNDSDAEVYTNAELLPVAAFVLGEMRDEFAKFSLPVVETVSTAFSYTANATTIPVPGSVTDFRHPIELWEKDTSSNVWIPMRRVDALPAPRSAAVAVLGVWEWSEDTLKVLACSANRDILVRYRRELAYPADGDPTTPGHEDFYWGLVAGVAYYAAQGTDRDNKADRFNGIYRKRVMDSIVIASQDLQVLNYRQRSANPNDRDRGPGWVVTN